LLKDYRAWLESELALLGNASHHAYAFGQANMAQRAIAELDKTLADALYVPLSEPDARAALLALDQIAQTQTALDPALERMRDAIRHTLDERPLKE
jgi:hypothetical protein